MKIWLVLPPLYYLYTWLNANPTIFNPEYMAVFMIHFMGQKIFKEMLRYICGRVLNIEINSQKRTFTTLISTILMEKNMTKTFQFTDNRILITNSFCIVPILGISYTTMCIALFVRTHIIKNHANITKLQRIVSRQFLAL